jgi:hypothetical protein
LGETVKGGGVTVAEARQEFQGKPAKAGKAIVAIDAFHSDIAEHWSTVSRRVLGHIVHAPPISFGTGPKQFTEG